LIKNKNNSRYRIIFAAVFLITVAFLTAGCNSLDSIKVKMGLKNMDFEFIKQNKVNQIVIQNIRDQGFRFTVTDKQAIGDLYDILSSAKSTNVKSTLEPDYTFEIHESNNTVQKFQYIAGIDQKGSGNLYSNNKIYIVSSRIDNDIIQSLWTIRKPKNFSSVYYDSITNVLDDYEKTADKNKKIGINLLDDVDSARFILSSDLEDFKRDIKAKYNNVELNQNYSNLYSEDMNFKTEGYKSNLYKATVIFNDKKGNVQKEYYIWDNYVNSRWEMKFYTEKPAGF
jgi:hypothetical protein